MNGLKIIAFVFCVTCFSYSIHAQRKSDVSIILGSYDLYRMNLEFRTPFKEKSMLRFGLTLGQTHTGFNNSNSSIISVTDSIVTERNYSSSSSNFGLKMGFERQIKESWFSFGGDVLLGYKKRNDYNYSTETHLIDGTWMKVNVFGVENYTQANDIRQRADRNMHYFNPGVHLKFDVNIPITKSFMINAAIGQTITLPLYTGQTIFEDPLNEFNHQGNIIVINSSSIANIGLRYQLK